jgi:hypothetical protein
MQINQVMILICLLNHDSHLNKINRKHKGKIYMKYIVCSQSRQSLEENKQKAQMINLPRIN